jgi:hypothetical protein
MRILQRDYPAGGAGSEAVGSTSPLGFLDRIAATCRCSDPAVVSTRCVHALSTINGLATVSSASDLYFFTGGKKPFTSPKTHSVFPLTQCKPNAMPPESAAKINTRTNTSSSRIAAAAAARWFITDIAQLLRLNKGSVNDFIVARVALTQPAACATGLMTVELTNRAVP